MELLSLSASITSFITVIVVIVVLIRIGIENRRNRKWWAEHFLKDEPYCLEILEQLCSTNTLYITGETFWRELASHSSKPLISDADLRCCLERLEKEDWIQVVKTTDPSPRKWHLRFTQQGRDFSRFLRTGSS